MDELLSTSVWRILALHRRPGRTRVIRPRHRIGSWTPEEAAEELHRRRVDLVGQLRCRRESSGVPLPAQEEIVDDAITAVVMSPRGVANEHHLLGAFWLAVDHRCRRYREGRHFARLGSRVRVEFDAALAQATGGVNPFDRLELRDRFARAVDLMADLSPREREVVAVMATYGVGPIPTARLLDVPLGEVRSAARSASAKLDRAAAIAAAGRMCEFRFRAIAADAAGDANDHEARLARAHVQACVPCGRVYRRLRREMRGREWQRAASAAFLPMPVVSLANTAGLGKVAFWIEQRLSFIPRGGGERTAEALGGAGIVKAAAAGTAIVVAGTALSGHIVHEITAPAGPRHHTPSAAIETRADAARLAAAWQDPAGSVVTLARTSSAAGDSTTPRVAVHNSSPTPPSTSDGYLALGGSSGGSSPSTPTEPSNHVRATAASVSQSGETSSSEAPPQPTQAGGGTSLSYLGR
jgi:DNA-directed RNA polymerase specialized sigma24 family protein